MVIFQVDKTMEAALRGRERGASGPGKERKRQRKQWKSFLAFWRILRISPLFWLKL
jgi:hypothetical protein